LEQLTKAHDLTQKLIIIENSPGQQDRLGVILNTHGEILNIPDQSTPKDIRKAPDKQQRAVAIFRQLMMMIAFITFKSSLVPLLEGL